METGQRLQPRPSSPSFTFMDQPLPQDRAKAAVSRPLVDAFGRTISYVRISVTARCDFRCRYCMSEAMSFMPRSQVLSLERSAEHTSELQSLLRISYAVF